ncbi:hypothetical protein [Nocardioides sp. LML1-1-1.1]|uniref:hypothetical protein n=1 Tax=Nocardioides sp. LML1-1-1.1 TaxID=3135248 RepID=UPI003429C157
MSASDGGLTPPGPPQPTEPAAETPAHPAPPAPHGWGAPSYAGPPAPAPSQDTGLGWTAFGLGVTLCVPCLPLVGAVLAIVTLARRRFQPRWLAVLTLVVGIGATGLQAAAVPPFLEGFREGMQESAEQDADDARSSGDPAQVSVLALEVGDCFDSAQLKAVDEEETVLTETVTLVPCAKRHDLEIYAAFPVPGEDFPGQPALDRRAARCVAAFKTFVGIAYGDSAFDFIYTYPTASSWKLDDRDIQCAIGHPKHKVTGSLRGRRR